jgi:hypothetical protein
MIYQNVTSASSSTSTKLIVITQSGTIAINQNTTAVTGTGTAFRSEFEIGDTIIISGVSYIVATITSDTALTISTPYIATNASGVTPSCIPYRLLSKLDRFISVTSHETNTGIIYVGRSLNPGKDGTDVTSTNRSVPLSVGQTLFLSRSNLDDFYVRPSVAASQRLSITVL